MSGERVLRISSDRDDQKIFSGLKFSISGFVLVGTFWQIFFGSLIKVGIVLGIQNNLKLYDSYHLTFPGNFYGSAPDFFAG